MPDNHPLQKKEIKKERKQFVKYIEIRVKKNVFLPNTSLKNIVVFKL